jgi:hypothetical protein
MGGHPHAANAAGSFKRTDRLEDEALRRARYGVEGSQWSIWQRAPQKNRVSRFAVLIADFCNKICQQRPWSAATRSPRRRDVEAVPHTWRPNGEAIFVAARAGT